MILCGKFEASRCGAGTLQRLLQSTLIQRIDAMSESSRELLFTQLSDIAPAISKLLKSHPSRIRAHVTTGDVINTYGVSMIFQVFVEVLMSRCKGCGETEFTPPNFGDCPNHKFTREWHEVASGETTAGTVEALRRADNLAAEWWQKRHIPA